MILMAQSYPLPRLLATMVPMSNPSFRSPMTVPMRLCRVCKRMKELAGCKLKRGKFTCAGCAK